VGVVASIIRAEPEALAADAFGLADARMSIAPPQLVTPMPTPFDPKTGAAQGGGEGEGEDHLRRRQHSLPLFRHLPKSPDSKVMPWTRSRAATDTASTIPHCGMLSRIQSSLRNSGPTNTEALTDTLVKRDSVRERERRSDNRLAP
jgi:hypothetical protein